jgi:hypothetical protein
MSEHRDPLLEGARVVRRVIDGVLPPPGGGPPALVANLTTHLLWIVAALVGFGLGALAGLLGFLAWKQLPDVPLFLLGLALGAVLGGLCSLLLVVRLRPPGSRRSWGLALLPLAVVTAPFVLLLWPRRKRRR